MYRLPIKEELKLDDQKIKEALKALNAACLHCAKGEHLEVCPINIAKLALTPDPTTKRLWCIAPK